MGRGIRAEQFSADEICIVHAIQRCVRRAFLAGYDANSKVDYSFRKEWIRRRMESLASVFGIDVLAYAVMSNHLHLILRNRPDVVAEWSDDEVVTRWLRVFPGKRLDEHLAEPTRHDVQALLCQPERVAQIRRRLADISWFMRALAEPIARMANRQDQCTGRFWEGRFKAQRIVDEAGLLACAMYVDLNPIRAAMAQSPDQALHTSAYDRIAAEQGAELISAAFDLVVLESAECGEHERDGKSPQAAGGKVNSESKRKEGDGKEGDGKEGKSAADFLSPKVSGRQLGSQKVKQSKGKGGRKSPPVRELRRIRRDGWLAPLSFGGKLASDPQVSRSGLRASDKGFLNLRWQDYLELLRWTAQPKTAEGVSQIPAAVGRQLSSLGVESSMWRDLVWNFKRYFGRSSRAGSPTAMSQDAARQQKSWYSGQRQVRACFTPSPGG
jgi:hypothetical protein